MGLLVVAGSLPLYDDPPNNFPHIASVPLRREICRAFEPLDGGLSVPVTGFAPASVLSLFSSLVALSEGLSACPSLMASISAKVVLALANAAAKAGPIPEIELKASEDWSFGVVCVSSLTRGWELESTDAAPACRSTPRGRTWETTSSFSTCFSTREGALS